MLRPLINADFVFPTWTDIAATQSVAGREKARLRVDFSEENGVLLVDECQWISNGAQDLLARILVVAHCGAQGHRDKLNNLRTSLRDLHREVNHTKERKRLQDMRAHKGTSVNFDVSDFVLWSRIDQRLPNLKLLGQWVGPFEVVKALPHSFEVKHLVTGCVYDVHASRLKFYADSALNTTEELQEIVSSLGMVLGVERFLEGESCKARVVVPFGEEDAHVTALHWTWSTLHERRVDTSTCPRLHDS
ncbi:hypothetical protein L916_15660 [Phytophthora nicotianae]|uniref:Uncharacterized protein n=1 Tax=Phytophthora nicotianae TaxID=4792 RepID=W2IBX1_PHYNI|nr:hypothetical protein L916_15660 [Phytophthora nicotianae]